MINPKNTVKCKLCQKEFHRYSTLQSKCGDCKLKVKREKDVQRENNDRKRKISENIEIGHNGHSRISFKKRGIGLKHSIPIDKVSVKQQKTNSNLAKIKAKKIIETGAACESCGRTSHWLDLSHFIPKSIRKDLEEHPDGCALACRGCHDALESLNGEEMAKFKNIDKILAFLEKNDLKRYNLVLNAINNTQL